MTISEKAKEYAEGKALNALTSAIETAYAEGYIAGYADGQSSKNTKDLVDGVEYVDLNLPHGTKWAADYLKDKDGKIVYLTYAEAAKLNIPTKEQYEELRKYCRLVAKTGTYGHIIGFSIVGTNSNVVNLNRDYYYEAEKPQWCGYPLFWLKSEERDSPNREAASIDPRVPKPFSFFMGNKLPIILVR